jgi:hypothetical protein
MGKPRRPRGGRPAWEPKPPLDADAPAEVGAEAPATGISTIETAKAVTAKYETAQDETAQDETVTDETVTDKGLSVEAAAAPEARPDAPAAQAAPETSDPQEDPQLEPSSAAAPDEAPIPEAEPVVQAGSAPTDAAPDLSPALVEPPAVAAAPAQQRIVFAPDRLDMIEISSTIARYMRGEGEAALAHLRALSDARTPADLIRLQVGEAQRAADASLSCWVTVVSKASRVMAFR